MFAASANRVEGICLYHERPVMIKACCGWKSGHVFVKVTTGETDVCVQWNKDRMFAIIHLVSPEYDGFIGYLSTSSVFSGDIVSERGICVCVWGFVCVCYHRSWSMTNSNQLGCVLTFLGKGSFSLTRSKTSDKCTASKNKLSRRINESRRKCLLFSEICGWNIKDPQVRTYFGLTLKTSLCCVTCVCACVCEWEQGPLWALMTADDRPRRTALWLMKAAATLRQVRLWRGGPRPTEDNTNDTAISPFNTCLANTLTMSSAAKIKPETLKKSSLNKLLVKRAGILRD